MNTAPPNAVADPTPSDKEAFPTFHSTPSEPLYTEINIPMPAITPTPERKPTTQERTPTSTPATLTPPSTSRSRALSLTALSPFHRRGRSRSSSTSSRSSTESSTTTSPPRKKEVKNREIAAMMNPLHRSKQRRGRSGTVDALAVVPAVLVLSAELFTPDAEDTGKKRRDSAAGRWEDGVR